MSTAVVVLMVVLLYTVWWCAPANGDLDPIALWMLNGPQGDESLHCASGDDDLGEQILSNSQIFTISFHPNIWGTTQFWCHAESGVRVRTFDVFGGQAPTNYGTPYSVFLWDMQPDGINLAQRNCSRHCYTQIHKKIERTLKYPSSRASLGSHFVNMGRAIYTRVLERAL